MSDNTEKLFLIEQELKQYLSIFKKTTASILDNEISKYPIYVVHKEDLQIGINVIDRFSTRSNWSIEASTLEEFVAKKLITESKVDEFRKTYKNSEEHACFFVVSELGAQFVFIAYPN